MNKNERLTLTINLKKRRRLYFIGIDKSGIEINLKIDKQSQHLTQGCHTLCVERMERFNGLSWRTLYRVLKN